LEKRHLFAPKPGQAFRQVRGVLGDAVVFGSGQVVDVGGSYAGAKVVAVGSDWVELLFEEESIVIGVYGGRGSYEREQKIKQAAQAKAREAWRLLLGKKNEPQDALASDGSKDQK